MALLGIDPVHFDIDIMYYEILICALHQHHPVPETYVGEIKRIFTYGVPFGYADGENWINMHGAVEGRTP